MSPSPATLRRSDFESRSVQLIAACVLGLAGVAHTPFSVSTRQVDAPRPTRPFLHPAGQEVQGPLKAPPKA